MRVLIQLHACRDNIVKKDKITFYTIILMQQIREQCT